MEGTQYWPIEQSNLLVTDGDSGPEMIIFNLTQLPAKGNFLLRNATTGALSKTSLFSQEDINERRVFYEHLPGSGNSDSFSFVVTDGTYWGHLRVSAL